MILSAKYLRLMGGLGLLLFFTGCASYYSHYAVFPAANSAGEPRQTRLTWETAEYPGWWFAADQATPIILETQCSQRRWYITDHTHLEAQSQCGGGIGACGTGRDQIAVTGEPAGGDTVCLTITDGQGAAKVSELGNRFALSVYCQPIAPTMGVGDEQENHDYVRASVVPYTILARKVARGSLNSRPPELKASHCDDE